MLLHAVDATTLGITSIEIVSPNTDVFVLSLKPLPELCENSSFVTGRGHRRRKILLSPIVCALGPDRTAVLPGFHAWSGADVTESFADKGKLTCWNTFIEADEDSVKALADLGTASHPTSSTLAATEKLVCQLYQPRMHISKVEDLRWLLFRKKQAQSERLTPTQASLKEAILRAHYRTMTWNNDKVPNSGLPSPETYGWRIEKDGDDDDTDDEEEEEDDDD
ncbi:hypothetical protein AWC38_SpisGene6717 [Stylophora pistillata]|uniref:Uncharacterized protein n=1 Tax=Stylophora pistillata TaxID=50429 RepID=A0A2B4SI82_STYPI|nr:hypothetical protein AWC38_SpisGene6717 [Stylophora pistillata]